MAKFNIPLLLIVTLAILLRFVFFNQSPPSINWDEASLGYNAYSILKTGKDEWGRSFPLTFEAFGDYKLPGYVYFDAPFIWLFGLSEFGVRLPSMIAGVLSVVLLYLIVRKISDDKNWALISALLLAISPWETFLSRVALEANLAFCLFLAGVYFLVSANKKIWTLTLSSLFFGLTLFTYNSARVFVPIFLFSLLLLRFKSLIKYKTLLILPGLVFLAFMGAAFYLALTQDSASRYYWVAILDDGAINFINQTRGRSPLDPVMAKLVYNKATYFAYEFFKNYLSHFSPQFLFLEGGSNYQFSVPKTGLLYLIELPFLLYGIYRIFKKRSLAVLFLLWLFLAPIPASITRESPHVLRSIFMLGSIQIIVGYGVVEAFRHFKIQLGRFYKLMVPLLLILLIIESVIYFNNYFFVYPKDYSESWQYGIKSAIEFVDTKENVSKRPLYITKKYGEPHIFYLFYKKYDPAKYQNNPSLVRYEKSNWRWVDRLDNVYFVNDWEMKEKLKDQHGYVISTPGNYPGIPPVQKSIEFLDGKGGFDVVEI